MMYRNLGITDGILLWYYSQDFTQDVAYSNPLQSVSLESGTGRQSMQVIPTEQKPQIL